MKLAVISDVHFGDPCSSLAAIKGGGVPELGRTFEPFAEAAGKSNDFLVLMGDIFDFSVSDYATAYAIASIFFAEVNRRGIAREILYIPGNHDFSCWNIALHEINVINQVKAGQLPKMRWTIPAVLDPRQCGHGSPLTLVGVGQREPLSTKHGRKYGGLFLDQFTVPPGSDLQPMTVNVAYPNAYVCDSEGATLLTHGHYFESYWSMTLSIVQRILGQDLVLSPGCVDLEALVSVNFPLNELASAGVGQAGPLTDVVRQIVADLRTGNVKREEQYVNAAFDYLDDEVFVFGPWGFLKEFLTDAFIGICRTAVLGTLRIQKALPHARNNRHFLENAGVRANLDLFLRACSVELANIRKSGIDVPNVRSMIFGHTHESIPSSTPISHLYPDTENLLSICNTGGWLESTPGSPIDAAVFTYDSERSERWLSRAIR